MSLFDALLLDPYRVNVFIAYRTDGVAGSGTQNDPYDGSPVYASPKTITGLSPAGLVATATTSAAHGYSDNDVVTIDVGTNPEGWSGTFLIYEASGTTFKYRMNRTPVPSPGGTMEARKVSGYRFDTVMASLGANTCVHLGPTPANRPFLTKGYPGSGGWQAKAGMRILGSGIDVTVLRLVGDATTGTYYAIGHSFAGGPVDCFEVAELTVDCNLMIPTAVTSAGCGAVRVLGSHVRVGRIKVINWGGNAAAKLSAVCLVMADDAASGVIATDSGMENVIAVSPASSESGALITALHVGPAVDDGLSAKERYGLAPYIRNCFVDCGWPTITTEFRGVAMAWCKGGVVEGNQIHNTKHGGPYASLSSARDIVVRNNYYKQVAKGPFWNYTSPTPALLASIVRESADTARATNNNGHNLSPGDRVRISAATAPAPYRGIFVVKDCPSTTEFRYTMTSDPVTNATGTLFMIKSPGVAKLVVEGNTIELATGANGSIGIHLADLSSSLQTPDYVHGEVVIRDNKIRYLDGAFDVGWTGYGVQANGVKNLLVRNNVVECAPAHPIANQRCDSVDYLNNKEPGGSLIRGYNADTGRDYNELETEAEEAFILGMIKRH